MTFQELLRGVETLGRSSTLDPKITSIAYDSRKVLPGSLFVAMKGSSVDGNKFVDAALSQGAVAIVSDSLRPDRWRHRGSIALARVRHGREALAGIGANFYGHPAAKLALTGVTGTNGKTTTTFLLEQILRHANRLSVLIGTVEYHVVGEVRPSVHTTPESLDVNAILAEGLAAGATEVVMEVSSHALHQRRVFGTHFEVAVFTNLSRDHLDYHSTMDEYFSAKKRLFVDAGAEPPRVAVVNVDDPCGRLLALSSQERSQVRTYGIAQGDFRAAGIHLNMSGADFDLVHTGGVVRMRSPLVGRVNVYNLLAAAVAASARGCSWEEIADAAAGLRPAPGRFEAVSVGQPFTVIVDYAHTDDALRNLVALARDFVRDGHGHDPSAGRVITLFGCGGDRDRTKRPMMGRAAGEGSDFVVLTSDNPRSEDPLTIIDEARAGLDEVRAKYVVEPDRAAAIAVAIRAAKPGDIVLLAGKGHEKVQIVKDGSLPFNDAAVARDILGASFGPERQSTPGHSRTA